MAVTTSHIALNMTGDTHLTNVTSDVQKILSQSGLSSGILTVFVKHTTAAVMIIEDEPGIRADTKTFMDRLIPANPRLQHNTRNPGEDNGHSHLRGQLQGPSVTIPFNDGSMTLGTWQHIVIVDFDTRPRTRAIVIQMIGE